MKQEKFEFPGDREAGMIGTMSRTRRMWKRNGNINTIGKELSKWNCPAGVKGDRDRRDFIPAQSKIKISAF